MTARFEKFGVEYEFVDDGEHVIIKMIKPDPEGGRDLWVAEGHYPKEDLLGFYHALGDWLMFSTTATREEVDGDLSP